MKMHAFLCCVLVMHPSFVAAEEQQGEAEAEPVDLDSSWKYHVRIGKLERQFSTSDDSDYGEWAGFIMVGKNLNTLWLTTKGSAQQGETDSAEIRLFYSRTIKPYIGAQLGWKRDHKPEPERDWLGFGLFGVLPTRLASMPVSLWVNPAAWRHGWK